MYQSIIRDPGGSGLIRISPDISGPYSAIVNGSILIVPPGTVAFVAINGLLSRAYDPGRYEIFTGTDPFFVRFRNILTNGDSGTSVSVFFISPEKTKFMTFGTGEFPFREHRFNTTMKALASCSLSFSIADPEMLLRVLVGSYTSAFSDEDIDPCIEQLILTPVHEAISLGISELDVTAFNSNLSRIGASAATVIGGRFRELGLRLKGFDVTAINVPDSELQRLYDLEKEYASGKIVTDLEIDHLQRIWGGNVNNRTLSEMMTGFSSRGQLYSSGNDGRSGEGGCGMTPMMLQMMMLSQLLPAIREPLSEMVLHTDMLGGTAREAQQNNSSADSPPAMPSRTRRCPSCNAEVSRKNNECPICGYRF